MVRPQDLLSRAQACINLTSTAGSAKPQKIHDSRRGPSRGGEPPGEAEQLLLESVQGRHELLDPRGTVPEKLIRKPFFIHHRVGFPKDERLQFQPPDSRKP